MASASSFCTRESATAAKDPFARNDSPGVEASWVERRKDTIANIKSGIVELQIKTALMKARRFIKVDD